MTPLDDALHGLLDLLENGNAFAVGQVGEVVATAVVILHGRHAQLDEYRQPSVVIDSFVKKLQ